MSAVVFFLSYAAVAFFGLPAAFHPLLRYRSVVARGAACFLLGTVLLSLEGLVWSLVGIPWTIWSLGFPLGAVSLTTAILLGRCRSTVETEAQPGIVDGPVSVAAICLAVCALAFLAWQLVTTRATSPDLLFFWGVKGARFAAAGGLDAGLLGWRYFLHAHVNYPPLVPILYAWSTFVAGGMPWSWVPMTSWIWIAATSAFLGPVLRLRLEPASAVIVTAIWTVVISASMVSSSSGGNAEAPLVAFVTVACAALLAVPSDGRSLAWAVVAVGFAGALLTKNEGSVSVMLLTGGAFLRSWCNHDRSEGLLVIRTAAAAFGCAGLWLLFLVVRGLPVADPIRQPSFHITVDYLGEILSVMPSGLGVGTATVSWWILIIALIASRRPIISFLPAAALCCGLLLFSFIYYLHSHTDPTTLVRWTLPRLCQPALSALVLWAGLAWFGDRSAENPNGT